ETLEERQRLGECDEARGRQVGRHFVRLCVGDAVRVEDELLGIRQAGPLRAGERRGRGPASEERDLRLLESRRPRGLVAQTELRLASDELCPPEAAELEGDRAPGCLRRGAG